MVRQNGIHVAPSRSEFARNARQWRMRSAGCDGHCDDESSMDFGFAASTRSVPPSSTSPVWSGRDGSKRKAMPSCSFGASTSSPASIACRARSTGHCRSGPSAPVAPSCIPPQATYTPRGISAPTSSSAPTRARHHAQDLKQHLSRDVRGVGARIVLRGNLDDIASDDVEPHSGADQDHCLAGG